MRRSLLLTSLLLAVPALSSAATVVVPITFTAGGTGTVGIALGSAAPTTSPTTVSGTINTRVTLDVSTPSSPSVTNVEFLGGETLSFSDVSINLGLTTVNSSAVKGDFTGSALVTAGNIGAGVSSNLNDGAIDTPATATNPDIDLNVSPFTGPLASGTISLSNIRFSGKTLVFDSNLSLPVSITQTTNLNLPVFGPTDVHSTVGGTVTGQSSGFEVVIPEPQTPLMLLAAGSLALITRRRRDGKRFYSTG